MELRDRALEWCAAHDVEALVERVERHADDWSKRWPAPTAWSCSAATAHSCAPRARWRGRRAGAGRQLGPHRLPVEGRARGARANARRSRGRQLRDRGADDARGDGPSRPAERAQPAESDRRAQRRGDRPRRRGARDAPRGRRSTTRTWPPTSPTASSSPRRPVRPRTRSAPAARSSIRPRAT